MKLHTYIRTGLLGLLIVSSTACVSYRGKKLEQSGVGTSPGGAYFRNRVMDARDIFSLTAIAGAVGGAQAQLGPVSVGLFAEIGHVGHGTRLVGEYGLLQGEAGKADVDHITILVGPLGTRDVRASNARARDRGKHIVPNEKLPPPAYTRLGVSAGACIGLRLEFNPGELLDFFLGLFGVDIYGDDIYKSKPSGD